MGDGGTPPEEPSRLGRANRDRTNFFCSSPAITPACSSELCRRDFRSYYRAEEDELRGFVRGRLNLPRYARLAVQGKPHILPCRWDEFTVDNWDNRILWGAARRLKDVAAALDAHAARLVWEPFRHLLSWFSPVAELPITAADFRKSAPRAHVPLLPAVPSAGRDCFSREATCRARAAGCRRWSWMRRPPSSDLPKWWRGRRRRTTPGTLISGKGVHFSPERQEQSIEPDIVLSGTGRTVRGGRRKIQGRSGTGSRRTAGNGGRSASRVHPILRLVPALRLHATAGASSGFFIVPFWNADGQPFEWLPDFRFKVGPCRGGERVAVLGLNMLKPLTEVKKEASERLRAWLS